MSFKDFLKPTSWKIVLAVFFMLILFFVVNMVFQPICPAVAILSCGSGSVNNNPFLPDCSQAISIVVDLFFLSNFAT